MTKILIAESLDVETLYSMASEKNVVVYNELSPNGSVDSEICFSYQPDLSVEDIESELCNYDGLIVRPKQVTAKAINSGDKLRLIVRGGAGLNSIDLKAAKNKGVVVENTPGQNSLSTAEYSFSLIMELVAARQIRRADSDVRAGVPAEVEEYQGQELAGKKIAIIGLGNIGLKVANMADAFGMDVVYYSNSKKDVDFIRFDSLRQVLECGADVISLHVPLDSQTEAMIAKDEFALMKSGTILVNCARPQLVDVSAFGWALQEGLISGAGIDGDMDLIVPFVQADVDNKCIFTHHIADSTKQAQEKITRQAVSQVLAFFREGKIINDA